MSETKKRIYNRSTAIEAMMDLSNKSRVPKKGTLEYQKKDV